MHICVYLLHRLTVFAVSGLCRQHLLTRIQSPLHNHELSLQFSKLPEYSLRRDKRCLINGQKYRRAIIISTSINCDLLQGLSFKNFFLDLPKTVSVTFPYTLKQFFPLRPRRLYWLAKSSVRIFPMILFIPSAIFVPPSAASRLICQIFTCI